MTTKYMLELNSWEIGFQEPIDKSPNVLLKKLEELFIIHNYSQAMKQQKDFNKHPCVHIHENIFFNNYNKYKLFNF